MADDPTRDDITRTLASGVRDRGIGLAYGDPVTVGGSTVIPVAFVSYGFGGVEDSPTYGTGGGGGGVAIPLGAYVEGPNGVRFRANSIALLSLAIPLLSTLGWAISLIVAKRR
ncbi:hypothetical protein [Herbiconiux daphne]|uniref:Sporulation protein YtfJ n=1 Tax=Herbiconiux daphne TaxID=2970914 RepID=A0ABT2GXT0_9MICO|nr:hypothetical protein [Herbiconiux daphne]MCS5732770.1 hypothetical protein [Herbiconiux daphne]